MLSFSEIDVAKVDLLGGINFENGLVKAYYSYFSSDRATADLLAKGYAFLRKEKKIYRIFILLLLYFILLRI